MSSKQIRIMLVDDHRMVRESIALLLSSDRRFSIIKECDNGQDAIEHAVSLKPDVMLLDINMYPVNGFEVAEKVLAENPSIRIIALSVNNQASYVNKMMNLGACGYITKGSSYEEIAKSILEVSKGQKYLSPDVRNFYKK
jgi:DNA-binding NarL/FixJ family response regulator